MREYMVSGLLAGLFVLNLVLQSRWPEHEFKIAMLLALPIAATLAWYIAYHPGRRKSE